MLRPLIILPCNIITGNVKFLLRDYNNMPYKLNDICIVYALFPKGYFENDFFSINTMMLMYRRCTCITLLDLSTSMNVVSTYYLFIRFKRWWKSARIVYTTNSGLPIMSVGSQIRSDLQIGLLAASRVFTLTDFGTEELYQKKWVLCVSEVRLIWSTSWGSWPALYFHDALICPKQSVIFLCFSW